MQTPQSQTNESAEEEQYSEDEMFMTDIEPAVVERAPPVPDTERVLETRTSSRVRKQKVKFNDESLVINDNGKRKLPKRAGTHSANPKRTSMTVPDDDEVFVSAVKAKQLVYNACLVDKTPETEFPIGVVHFDCRKALRSEYKEGFIKSMKSELDSIEEYKVMTECYISEVPKGTKIFNSYMLCHRKSLGGDEWKCKSRLIVDGSCTIPGVHTKVTDISTDLPRWDPVRMMIATAKGKGWWIRQGDVKTAFLKGNRSGIRIFMHMPLGLRKYGTAPDGRSCEIVQAVDGNLYGKVCMHVWSTHCITLSRGVVVRQAGGLVSTNLYVEDICLARVVSGNVCYGIRKYCMLWHI